MNTDDARKQVSHMRDFIMHEAREKADEISAKAEQDYTVEKQRLVEEEKLRIKKEFERRESNVSLESKIANATETNKNKLLVLAAASGQVEDTFKAAYDQLQHVAKDGKAYPELLANLLNEGLAMLGQSEALVRCRAEDKSAVEKAISSYKGPVKLSLDSDPLKNDASCTNIDTACIGGMIVMSTDKKIVVSQTLNSRLQVAYDTSLPIIKPKLFNQQGSKHTC